ncbi:MAG: GMC family oxidoreductase N-terminal domain-containing protein [Chloroflexota bacterium]|nr:GMC family oxidoreductase N-terminal domain-containing protein [Chloroflexota bacterium]
MSEPQFLSAAERRVLQAVCDTFVPALEPPPGVREPAQVAHWRCSAAAGDVAAAVETTLALETTPEQQRQIRLALRLLDHPAALRLLTGSPQPFRLRSLPGREAVLRGWSTSRLPALRQAFLAFKRLACFHFYAHQVGDGPNPNAAALGYPYPGGPLPLPAPPANPGRPLRPLIIDRDTVLDADVCIVGSGAGGGVAAALLAAAGKRVVVLEDGGPHQEAGFDGGEESGWERLYARRGALTTADGGMVLLAGRTLGGGTTVNWTTCFRPTERLLAEWAAQSGLSDLRGAALADSYAAVERRINAHVGTEPLNRNNALLLAGAARLGLAAARNPRNVTAACTDCGRCHFGCRSGGKQGTLRTYLQDAAAAGAQIVTNAWAARVLLRGDRAVGVAAWVHAPVEDHAPAAPRYRLTVRAAEVIVAGGAIGTPALLLRSGVRGPHLGRHLTLHPATGILGRWATAEPAWQGPIQATYSNAFADLSGDGYGVRLEAVPIYPGFGAIVTPWTGAGAFRRQLADLAHYSALLVLTRDRVGGRVVLDRQGGPRIVYRPSAESRRHLVRGMVAGARLVLAAGADAVQTLHTPPVHLRAGGSPAAFARAVAVAGADPHRLLVGSAHQMGTARMARDPRGGVTDGLGRVHGVAGLRVLDTSLFPSASGVNPMLTTLGLVHWLVSRGL